MLWSLSFDINGKNEGFDFVFEMQTVKNSMLRHGVFEDKPLIKVSKLDTSVHLAYITNGDHLTKIHWSISESILTMYCCIIGVVNKTEAILRLRDWSL